MTQALTTTTNGGGNVTAYSPDWARHQEKLDLLKRTIAEGASDDEFALFVEVAKSAGLNPFQRQIYAIMRNVKVKRNGRDEWEKRMTIQTGIDGYRLIAARTGVHAGTSDAEFGPVNDAGQPEWARVTVKKLMPGGHIAEFPATARWAEYVQTDRNGNPSGMWDKMPFNQLAKCAEALGLRKAFPAELSGIYTAEEMAQADNIIDVQPVTTEPQASDWDKANKRLRAIVGKAGKALDLPGSTMGELVKELIKAEFGFDSSKECTADDLRHLADMIDANPKVLIASELEPPIPDSFDAEAPFVGTAQEVK